MKIFGIAVILFSVQWAFAAPTVNNCRWFFNYPDGTEAFKVYVSSAGAELRFGDADFLRLLEGLQHGLVVNPISTQRAKVDAVAHVHRHGLEKIIQTSTFDIAELTRWVQVVLSEQGRTRTERTKTESDTHPPYHKMMFVHLGQGPNGKVLRLMKTHVTQYMWGETMGMHPSYPFEQQDRNVDWEYVRLKNGKTIAMRADAPVDNMTWWSALVYANQESKRHGLPEVYDLSGIQFKSVTSNHDLLRIAARGELEALNDDQSVEVFKSRNSVERWIQSSGLRLPTVQEYWWLITMLRENMPSDICEYAWCRENARNAPPVPQPIGTRPKNFVIQGQTFFDLWGNVSIWLSNFLLEPAVNSDGKISSHLMTYQSVGSINSAKSGVLGTPVEMSSYHGEAYNGIRLIQTVAP